MAGDGREFAATVLDSAAELATKIAVSSGDPVVRIAVAAGAALAALVAGLVRTLGINGATKTLEELKRRVNAGEGVLTDADLDADDVFVDEYIEKLFG